MDRNQAKEFYPVLKAFVEGKAIECSGMFFVKK